MASRSKVDAFLSQHSLSWQNLSYGYSDQPDEEGRTALMLAHEHGHEASVKILEEAGVEGEIPAIELRKCNAL